AGELSVGKGARSSFAEKDVGMRIEIVSLEELPDFEEPAAHVAALLENGDPVSLARQTHGSRDAGGSAPDHGHARAGRPIEAPRGLQGGSASGFREGYFGVLERPGEVEFQSEAPKGLVPPARIQRLAAYAHGADARALDAEERRDGGGQIRIGYGGGHGQFPDHVG